ncbi:hypothetical protein NPIL_28131 [Nephila pilipes]|uniref:Uncharacterized protein n=1 Tax=Nephila pilipes TaxID=299642 RepID=A0A8X6PK27_NEPPI|nr:hypothetical protein NPIL_28131 [Nephila pilipes]
MYCAFNDDDHDDDDRDGHDGDRDDGGRGGHDDGGRGGRDDHDDDDHGGHDDGALLPYQAFQMRVLCVFNDDGDDHDDDRDGHDGGDRGGHGDGDHDGRDDGHGDHDDGDHGGHDDGDRGGHDDGDRGGHDDDVLTPLLVFQRRTEERRPQIQQIRLTLRVPFVRLALLKIPRQPFINRKDPSSHYTPISPPFFHQSERGFPGRHSFDWKSHGMEFQIIQRRGISWIYLGRYYLQTELCEITWGIPSNDDDRDVHDDDRGDHGDHDDDGGHDVRDGHGDGGDHGVHDGRDDDHDDRDDHGGHDDDALLQ